MERWTNDDGVQGLFEVFTMSQRLILNSLDYRQARFTKYQLYLMMTLVRKQSLTMSQAAACIGCSKEQATRLVKALEEGGYVERIHCEENRKLVFIHLTARGQEVMSCEKTAAREKLKKDLDGLSEEEKDVFFRSMGQLACVLKKLEARQEKRKADHEDEI